MQEVIDTLRAALQEDVLVEPVVRRLTRLADGASRAEPVGPLAQARAVAALDLWTRVRWRRGLRAEVATAGTELVVRTPETTLRLPSAAEPALRRLLDGEVLAVAELGAGDDGPMDDAGRLEVAATLLRSAVAVPE